MASADKVNDPDTIMLPGSAAYKKAFRNFRKSSRNQHMHDDVSSSGLTSFRSAEKTFKAKFPPPDLSNVLDLALLDRSRGDEINSGVWRGRADAIETREIRLSDDSPLRSRKAFCVPRIPGKHAYPENWALSTSAHVVIRG